MALGVRTKLTGGEALARALERAHPSSQRIAGDVLRKLALHTAKIAAEDKIKRGGVRKFAFGVGVSKPLPNKLTSRTGTGRRSIGVNLAPLPNAAEVGSDLEYMAVHEAGGRINIPRKFVKAHFRTVAFGRKVGRFRVGGFYVNPHKANYPRRPWLEPAVDDVLREAPRIAARIWEGEIK
tara:strand:+ start:807 stop:1346 length:540 start_codon:yes stop_codon:yes gene_type:complete